VDETGGKERTERWLQSQDVDGNELAFDRTNWEIDNSR